MKLGKKTGKYKIPASQWTMSFAYFLFRLKDMLRERLLHCGWRDEMKEFCKEVIRRKGLEKVTVEELVAEITPKGRGYIAHFLK